MICIFHSLFSWGKRDGKVVDTFGVRVDGAWTRPAGVKVHRIQKVQKVQRVVEAASPQFL